MILKPGALKATGFNKNNKIDLEKMKTIKKIDAVSVGKVLGAMYGFMALILGGFFTLMSLFWRGSFSQEQNFAGVFFGLGAVIFLPLLYGAIGFAVGTISGWLYNATTKWSGGLKIELLDE